MLPWGSTFLVALLLRRLPLLVLLLLLLLLLLVAVAGLVRNATGTATVIVRDLQGAHHCWLLHASGLQVTNEASTLDVP